jgi:hypothetical protein
VLSCALRYGAGLDVLARRKREEQGLPEPDAGMAFSMGQVLAMRTFFSVGFLEVFHLATNLLLFVPKVQC